MFSPVRSFLFSGCLSPPPSPAHFLATRALSASSMAAAADESEDLLGAGAGGAVSLSEWQAWGTISPVPAMVSEVIEGLSALKNDTDAPMTFGGIGGKLQDLGEKPLNFVLIDGTWSNSAAVYRRLKDRWTSEWGDEDPPSVSLSTTGLSAMHKLRPQPAWDRICTAAAAAGLLSELHLHPEFNLRDLDKQAESVEEALGALLDAVTTRRLRKGRSIARRERKSLSRTGLS